MTDRQGIGVDVERGEEQQAGRLLVASPPRAYMGGYCKMGSRVDHAVTSASKLVFLFLTTTVVSRESRERSRHVYRNIAVHLVTFHSQATACVSSSGHIGLSVTSHGRQLSDISTAARALDGQRNMTGLDSRCTSI